QRYHPRPRVITRREHTPDVLVRACTEHDITQSMNLIRSSARILTGSTYVALGFDAARAPGGRVDLAGPTLATLRRAAPLPQDDELLVRANAAIQVAAGASLALGLAQRSSALALAASLVPTTAAGHAF